MTNSQRMLCGLYGLIALAALIATWSQNIAYFDGGAAGAFPAFLDELRVNPASRSISVDIALFLYAAAIFMVFEARRVGVRFVWAYIIAGMVIAISVTFPLFLIAREVALSKGAAAGGRPGPLDIIGLALLGVVVAALSGYLLGG